MPPLKKTKVRNPHSERELKALADAVEKLHGAKASFVRSEAVNEQFQGAAVWNGVVSQFALTGHDTASNCYAWSVPATSDSRERFYAVLRTPDVDSPEKAVRASIIADARASSKPAD